MLERHFVEPPGLFNGRSYESSLSTLRFMHKHAFVAKLNKQIAKLFETSFCVCPYLFLFDGADGER